MCTFSFYIHSLHSLPKSTEQLQLAKLAVEGRATAINPNLRLVDNAHAHNDDKS